jgi:hypothetical protein
MKAHGMGKARNRPEVTGHFTTGDQRCAGEQANTVCPPPSPRVLLAKDRIPRLACLRGSSSTARISASGWRERSNCVLHHQHKLSIGCMNCGPVSPLRHWWTAKPRALRRSLRQAPRFGPQRIVHDAKKPRDPGLPFRPKPDFKLSSRKIALGPQMKSPSGAWAQEGLAIERTFRMPSASPPLSRAGAAAWQAGMPDRRVFSERSVHHRPAHIPFMHACALGRG